MDSSGFAGASESSGVDDLVSVDFPRDPFLDARDMDAMLALNRDWIYMKPVDAHLNLERYIAAHDPVVAPFLRAFFESIRVDMITADVFLRELRDCVD